MKPNSRFIPFFILGLFLLSRLVNSSATPLFADEAYAILRAREINMGFPLLGTIRFGTQPIFIWMIALLQHLPISLVNSARLVSAIAGFVTAVVLGKVSSRLIGRQTFWWAFGIMLILPFSLFYDRTALFESLTSMWVVLGLTNPVWAMPLGILTKQTAWMAFPLAVGLNIRNKRTIVLTLLSTIFVPLAIWVTAFGGWQQVQATIFGKTSAPLSLEASFKGNIFRVKLWLLAYLTWPVMLMAGIGLLQEGIQSLRSKAVTPLVMIGAWGLGIIFFESLTARILYPRYMHFIIIAVVLLTVRSLFSLSKMFRKKLATLLMFGFIAYLPIQSDLKIIFQPLSAPLALEDRFQFYDDFTSGTGAKEISTAVESIVYRGEIPISVYVEDDNAYMVELLDKKDLRGATVEAADWLTDPLPTIPKSVFEKDREVLFIRNRHPDIPADWPVELILEVPKTDSRSVYLYRIIK